MCVSDDEEDEEDVEDASDHYYDYDEETPPRFDFQYLWARSGEEVRSLSSGSCPLSGTPSHAVDLGSTSPFLPFSHLHPSSSSSSCTHPTPSLKT